MKAIKKMLAMKKIFSKMEDVQEKEIKNQTI